jgi:hypothetical protein
MAPPEPPVPGGGTAGIAVIEVNVRAAGVSMDAVAERVVGLLEAGTVRVVDFAGGAGDQATIRAVGYPGGDDGA